MYNSFLTYALRQIFLYKWFDRTWLYNMFYIILAYTLSQTYFYNDLFTLGRSKCIILFWPSVLGIRICTSDLNTPGRTYALRMTYLYKRFDQTWQERNVWLYSDQCSKDDIIVPVIWSLCGENKCIIPCYAPRETYLYKSFDRTWQGLNISFFSGLCS